MDCSHCSLLQYIERNKQNFTNSFQKLRGLLLLKYIYERSLNKPHRGIVTLFRNAQQYTYIPIVFCVQMSFSCISFFFKKQFQLRSFLSLSAFASSLYKFKFPSSVFIRFIIFKTTVIKQCVFLFY